MDLAGLPVPAPVLDSPATRHDLLFLLGRVAQAMDASLEAEREIACRGACPLRSQGMLFVSQRVVDVLAFTRPRCDQLAEIVLVAFLRSGDLK